MKKPGIRSQGLIMLHRAVENFAAELVAADKNKKSILIDFSPGMVKEFLIKKGYTGPLDELLEVLFQAVIVCQDFRESKIKIKGKKNAS